MGKRGFSAEQIVFKLRQIEVPLLVHALVGWLVGVLGPGRVTGSGRLG
jgi:hypothetical protein